MVADITPSILAENMPKVSVVGLITERDAVGLIYATYADGNLGFSGQRKRVRSEIAWSTSDTPPRLRPYS